MNHGQMVNGLVLGCTTPGGGANVPASPEVLAMLVPVPGLSREDQIRKAWPAMCAPAFIGSSRPFLEAMLQSSLRNPTPIETLAKQMAAIQGFDASGRLSEIKAPALIIHGDADVLVLPQNGRALHEEIAGSEMKVIAGSGHMFFWEKPEESARAITEFLNRVPAQTGQRAGA